MDAVFQFWALMAIALAIHSGLRAIAAAIRYSTINVRFVDRFIVEHQGKNNGSPT